LHPVDPVCGVTHPSAAAHILYAPVDDLQVISPTTHLEVDAVVLGVQSAAVHILDPFGTPQVIDPTAQYVVNVAPAVQLPAVADPAGEFGVVVGHTVGQVVPVGQ
jgi:hypothetical protein